VTFSPLPTLAERPNAEVVIYDGECGFCQHQMRKIDRWDRDEQLAYVSLHDPQVAERWPELSKDDLMRQMCLVTQDKRHLYGADAFKHIAGELCPLWPISLAMRIPWSMPVWRFLYRQFARQRYRLSKRYACNGNACQMHTH
jgi:predicted DCC family thiol-disulfide oxidoreductase YuxK